MSCSWNHRGDKIAVASASGNLFIGSYQAEQSIWGSLNLSGKRPHHKSTVLSCHFEQQSGRVIASSSADCTVLLSTCYVEGIDVDANGPFGAVTSFGEVLLKFTCDGWPNTVKIAPNSQEMVYCTQDCEVNFVNLQGAAEKKKNPP